MLTINPSIPATEPVHLTLGRALKSIRLMSAEQRVDLLVRAGVVQSKQRSAAVKRLKRKTK